MVLGAFGLLPAAVRALEWTTQIQTCTTAPFQDALDVRFAFKNTGPKPVTILEVETSCGCVDAAADRKTYAPGEAGTVIARVAIGDRFGAYERTISVLTDENPDPVRLQVRLEVPELATVSPRSMNWKVGGPATEQTVELRPAAGLEVEFTKAEVTSEDFSVRLEAVQPGRLYRVHLKPTSTRQTANAAVRLYGHDRQGRALLVSAYGNVQ